MGVVFLLPQHCSRLQRGHSRSCQHLECHNEVRLELEKGGAGGEREEKGASSSLVAETDNVEKITRFRLTRRIFHNTPKFKQSCTVDPHFIKEILIIIVLNVLGPAI